MFLNLSFGCDPKALVIFLPQHTGSDMLYYYACCTPFFPILVYIQDTVYWSHLLFCHPYSQSTNTYTNMNTHKPKLELHSLTASILNTEMQYKVNPKQKKATFCEPQTLKNQTHNQMLNLLNLLNKNTQSYMGDVC